jgi:hypothetical protein
VCVGWGGVPSSARSYSVTHALIVCTALSLVERQIFVFAITPEREVTSMYTRSVLSD